MKLHKLFLMMILALSFTYGGCQSLSNRFASCDKECQEAAKRNGEMVKGIVYVGFPVAAGSAGALATFLTIMFYPRKKREQ